VEVFDGDNAPDSADEKFFKLTDELVGNLHILRAQVCKEGFIGIAALVQLRSSMSSFAASRAVET
jgi:hypothetical protein